MPMGKVKWYNPEKGYGFITNEEGKKSLYINQALLTPLGLFSLTVDQSVEYELDENRREKHVMSIRLLAEP